MQQLAAARTEISTQNKKTVMLRKPCKLQDKNEKVVNCQMCENIVSNTNYSVSMKTEIGETVVLLTV